MRKTLINAVLWTLLAVCNLIWRPHQGDHFVSGWIITVGSCILSVMGWGQFVGERRKAKGGDVEPPAA